jgi:hypothetical protein
MRANISAMQAFSLTTSNWIFSIMFGKICSSHPSSNWTTSKHCRPSNVFNTFLPPISVKEMYRVCSHSKPVGYSNHFILKAVSMRTLLVTCKVSWKSLEYFAHASKCSERSFFRHVGHIQAALPGKQGGKWPATVIFY